MQYYSEQDNASAESEGDARESTTRERVPHLSAVGKGANSPAAYQRPTGLRHRQHRSHYACTQSHTQSHPFREQPPQPPTRSVSPLNSSDCETRGLPVLIAAHAMLWPTWRLCSFRDGHSALQEFSGLD
jgi:hypothetical protein